MQKRLFSMLLLLDGLALGGLVASFLIGNLILDMSLSASQMNQTLYNLLDHIFPYKVFFAAMLCVVVFLTMVVSFVGKPRGMATDPEAK